MTDAIRIFVRYDLPNETGKTRRDRNEEFEEPSPLLIVTTVTGKRLYNWYRDISSSNRRVRQGATEPIPPSEFKAWSEMTGHILPMREYEVLREMDRAYCEESDNELSDYQEREAERMKNGNK